MPRAAKGYIEQLPSGSFRVTVYVGTEPLTGRAIRLKATAKTEQQARIELGRLLKDASEGRTPESAATVATLLEEYALVVPWDVSTRQTNEGFIRRTIKPALGHIEVRKVRGSDSVRMRPCGGSDAPVVPPVSHAVLALRARPAWTRSLIDRMAKIIPRIFRIMEIAR
jgi:hypothetical protein